MAKSKKQKTILNGKGNGFCPTCEAQLHGRNKEGLRNTMKKCTTSWCGQYGCCHCMIQVGGGQWRHSPDWCIRLKKEEIVIMSSVLSCDEVIAAFERMAEDITMEHPDELYSSMTLNEAKRRKAKNEQESTN